MEDEIAVPQCLTCQQANIDPERLTTLNRWLAEGKAYKWIIARAKALWSIDLNERSLKRHYKNGHMPEWFRIAREAGEQALGEEYADIFAQGLGGLNLVARMYINSQKEKLINGEEINIPHNVGIQAIKELNQATANKPTYKVKVVTDAVIMKLIEVAVQCIPPVKQAIFYQMMNDQVAPMAIEDERRRAIEEKIVEAEGDLEREEELRKSLEEKGLLEEDGDPATIDQ